LVGPFWVQKPDGNAQNRSGAADPQERGVVGGDAAVMRWLAAAPDRLPVAADLGA
jgi:hypothetical protein